MTITVTIADDSPLMVTADGADTSVPADKVAGASPAVGERWIVEVRTPNKPLCTTKETAV